MNLIDTNAVTYIFESGLQYSETYYMAPDVNEEVEMTQTIYGKKLPQNILHISNYVFFDESIYINFYNEMLNTKGGRSFFNMTGFGDISILATTHTLINTYSNQKQLSLLDSAETINIFTNDEGLRNRVIVEFSNNDVHCRTLANLI